MKREIDCMKCRLWWHQQIDKEPGEHIRIKVGKAKSPYVCDFCGKSISENDECAAVSLYTDSLPYSRWEDDFLIEIKEEKTGE